MRSTSSKPSPADPAAIALKGVDAGCDGAAHDDGGRPRDTLAYRLTDLADPEPVDAELCTGRLFRLLVRRYHEARAWLEEVNFHADASDQNDWDFMVDAAVGIVNDAQNALMKAILTNGNQAPSFHRALEDLKSHWQACAFAVDGTIYQVVRDPNDDDSTAPLFVVIEQSSISCEPE